MLLKRTIFLALLLSSCNVGKPYQRPSSEAPSAWKGPVAEEAEGCKVPDGVAMWWEVFNDPELNRLAAQAVASNRSLEASFYRLLQARAMARVSRADLFPEVLLAPAYFSQGSLMENPMPAASKIDPMFRFHQINYTLPFDASYEVDLWGRVRNSYDAGIANAQASFQERQTILLSVTAEVAMSYFRLLALDTQQYVLERGIALRQSAVEVNQCRYEQGLVNYVNVSRAKVELSTARAESADIARQRAIQENILAVLCGVPASEFHLDPRPLHGMPPAIPAGIPSVILCQRPDIAQAERQMASLHTEIGVAYASFFPSLILTGSAGLSSPELRDLFDWRARLWSIGANMVQVIVDGGRIRANVDIAKAQYQESLSNYEQTVLVAFQEVEDSLANIHELARQAQELNNAAYAAQETTDLSKERYDKGLVNYLDVVDAERSLLEAQRNAAKVTGDQYVSTVQLVKALGGTW
jgi:outer membrane protein, multidrug efflux system